MKLLFFSLLILITSCSTSKDIAPKPIITKKDILMSRTNQQYSDASILGAGGKVMENLLATISSDFHEEISKIEGISIDPTTGYISIAQYILFDFDSSTVNEKAVEVLRQIAAAYSKLQNAKIKIIGHTDNIGEEAYNEQLSLSRAKAVSNAFIALGISQNQLSIKGAGEREPIADNSTIAGRNKNRRVELVIIQE